MPGQDRHRRVTVLLCVIGAFIGLVVAGIVVLNLHIAAGLEQGYAATASEVVEYSPVLAVVDVVLLVGGPVLGVLAALRLQRALARASRRDPSATRPTDGP